MALTDQARMLLEMVYRVGAPRFHELSVQQARHSFEKLQFAFGFERIAVASVTEVPIGRSDGSALLARLYRPTHEEGRPRLPLVLYFHGGGWCIGDVQSYDSFCRELTNASACAVLSVDYRLAPEHPFPAAVEDARLALDWVHDNAELLEVDRDAIALAGDSAGGTLAIVSALGARGSRGPAVSHLGLIYPCAEILSARPSRERYADGYFLDRASLEWFFTRYLPDGQVSDWRASPYLAASLSNLPSMTLVTAECDPLTDDCVAFIERVRNEGGSVEHIHVEGMIHGFATLGRLFPQAGETVRAVGRALRTAFARP